MFNNNVFLTGIKAGLSFSSIKLISVAPFKSAIKSFMVEASLPEENERSITSSLLFPRLSISDTPFILNPVSGLGACATGSNL